MLQEFGSAGYILKASTAGCSSSFYIEKMLTLRFHQQSQLVKVHEQPSQFHLHRLFLPAMLSSSILLFLSILKEVKQFKREKSRKATTLQCPVQIYSNSGEIYSVKIGKELAKAMRNTTPYCNLITC